MLYATLKLLHLLALVVWIGGMVFAHFFLRPAALALPPPQRLPLMQDVLRRFFGAVTVAVLVVLGSGLWMIARMARETVRVGLSFNMPLDWTLMATLGLVMMAIFAHIRFALFRRMSRAVQAQDWPAAGAALGSIRSWVGVNLSLGVVIIAFTLLMV